MRVRIAIAGAVIGTTVGITIGRTVRWWRTWGVDPVEARKSLPGDDLVATPTAIDTRGIIIDAPPDAIWPWLVQMGYGRGGWYSYDQIDMLGKSADRILPTFQAIAVGDVLPTSPTSGFAVRIVEQARALVLYSDTESVASRAGQDGAINACWRHGSPRRTGGHRGDPADHAARLRRQLGVRARTARRRSDTAHRAIPGPLRRGRSAASGSSRR